MRSLSIARVAPDYRGSLEGREGKRVKEGGRGGARGRGVKKRERGRREGARGKGGEREGRSMEEIWRRKEVRMSREQGKKVKERKYRGTREG